MRPDVAGSQIPLSGGGDDLFFCVCRGWLVSGLAELTAATSCSDVFRLSRRRRSGIEGGADTGTRRQRWPFHEDTGGAPFPAPGARHHELRLKDQQVTALMNWLVPALSGSSLSETFQPYSVDEITRSRQTKPGDFFVARKAIARQLKDMGYDVAPY